jgi:hypothetical protein
MRISRRNFLSVAGTVAALSPFRSVRFNTLDPRPKFALDCAVIDLGAQCSLRESLQGYQAMLAGKYHHLSLAELISLDRCRVAIVPGVGRLDAVFTSALSGLLKAGATVLFESGAGFLSPCEFISHQKTLHQYFDITIGRPVDLWSRSVDHASNKPRSIRNPRSRQDNPPSAPYVHYRWPSETKVRDFSRAMTVSAPMGNAIAKVGDLPVAWKTRVGRGTLIFLGSPMGPALRAGDSDAHNWLHSVIAL